MVSSLPNVDAARYRYPHATGVSQMRFSAGKAGDIPDGDAVPKGDAVPHDNPPKSPERKTREYPETIAHLSSTDRDCVLVVVHTAKTREVLDPETYIVNGLTELGRSNKVIQAGLAEWRRRQSIEGAAEE